MASVISSRNGEPGPGTQWVDWPLEPQGPAGPAPPPVCCISNFEFDNCLPPSLQPCWAKPH